MINFIKTLIAISVTSVFIVGCSTVSKSDVPFSFSELLAEPQMQITDKQYFETSDAIKLAYFDYSVVDKPKQVLVFIHGGGACSSLGYQYLADTLSKQYNTRVYLLDMRGHGLSDGERGDAPTKERLWQDISEFINFVRSDNINHKIYLGGHSSGGGLVLNYATWKEREDINGYVFISPKLGYKSNADRYHYTKDPFAKAHIGTMVLNKVLNEAIYKHTIAVEMNYCQEAKKAEPLLVDTYTCTVVNAITPINPEKQFSTIDKPFCLFVGSNDELMLPENTVKYAEYSNNSIKSKSQSGIIQNQNHLGILRVCGKSIGEYLFNANSDS